MDVNSREAALWSETMRLKSENERLRALVEEAYREGVSHGESSAIAFEWGEPGDKYQTWEHSDARAALSAVGDPSHASTPQTVA